DELYFIVAGHHLAFGYVDQPPLAPLLTRVTDIFGVSPTAIRILPALAAGVGLEADNLVVLLLIGLALGLLVSPQRPVLRTRWPWLGAGIAAVIWAPNLIWQATHGWPQLAMSAALHQQNTAPADYAGALPAQLLYLGLLVAPLIVAGFVVLWRTPELRFLAVTATLVLVYVLAWVPGKVYYADGVAPVVLAAGASA